MSRKSDNTQGTPSGYGLVKLCAFWGLVVSGIASCLAFIFAILKKCGIEFTGLQRVITVCSTVAQIAIGIAAIIAGFHYLRGKSKVLKAFYWIAVILFILGLVGINIYNF